MKKATLKEKLAKLWKALAPALSYRTKPGCPTCITPIMDETGKPEVPHCSRWTVSTDTSSLKDGTDLTGE